MCAVSVAGDRSGNMQSGKAWYMLCVDKNFYSSVKGKTKMDRIGLSIPPTNHSGLETRDMEEYDSVVVDPCHLVVIMLQE
jgi:hypothetical protein